MSAAEPLTGREAQGHLAGAAETGTVVTATRRNGKAFTGLPVEIEGTGGLVFTLKTGKRGRPVRLHVDDVVSVVNAEPDVEEVAA